MKTVAVIHAHIPTNASLDEQDTLLQAEAISDALRLLGFEPKRVEMTIDMALAAKTLSAIKPAFAFNLVESVDGAGRLIHLAPTLLDHLGIPYTGNGTEAMFTTSNKLISKKMFRAAGIPTADWFESIAADGARFVKGQYIVKAAWEHASVGLDEENIIDAKSPDDLVDAIKKFSSKAAGGWFAERYIDGREFNLSVISTTVGPRVLPPAEILFNDYPADKPRIVGYRAKWIEDSFEYGNTPRSFDWAEGDTKFIYDITNLAILCWNEFGLNGYARVDFRVDENSRPWVLEINANPCINPDSGFIAAAKMGGLEYIDVIKAVSSALVGTVRE